MDWRNRVSFPVRANNYLEETDFAVYVNFITMNTKGVALSPEVKGLKRKAETSKGQKLVHYWILFSFV